MGATPSPAPTHLLLFDARRASGGQRVVGVTEDGVEASVPHQPYEIWCDPSGNVCSVPISTNRDPRARDPGYANVVHRRNEREKWLRWDVVPFGMTQSEWEIKREEERKNRVERAAKNAKQFERIGQDHVTAFLEAQAKGQAGLAQAIGTAIGQALETKKAKAL